jgi:NAD(P)-dependent dehydrogenase (short-subunit alcohol dehydrogenase family)
MIGENQRIHQRESARSWHDLTGRVALITGAGRGLGAAMAKALAVAGAAVILWGKHPGRLSRVEQEIEALGRPTLAQRVDVTDRRAVRRAATNALRRFHRIDILVNNAGIWDGDPFVTLTPSAWTRVIDTDLTSLFHVSQAVAPSMMRRRYGKIIHISSTSGILVHPEGAAYGSAKAAVIHLTKIMAVELGPHGIRVNAIAPGLFRTDMTADVFADRAWVARRTRGIPLRRFGEPEDLEGLVVFLASRGSDHITGQTIVIDAGASLVIG